jgi:hypothetical protein
LSSAFLESLFHLVFISVVYLTAAVTLAECSPILANFGVSSFRQYPFTLKVLFSEVGPVTSEERERMEYLCNRIAVEKNPAVFLKLVEDLNNLLALKRQRIDPEPGSTPS